GFADVADIMVGSFYDPQLDEGCAFEELISFHGGMGGPQTRPFVLYPAAFSLPDEPIVGAASVHALLRGWRKQRQGSSQPAGSELEARRAAATWSRRAFVSSCTKIWIVAASGTAVNAPSTPSKAPKSVTATMMKKPDRLTALPWILGVKML